MTSTAKKILLHACCAPCSTHCVETLRGLGYEPTLFFSNSNIMPCEEYALRLETIRTYSQKAQVSLVEDFYDSDSWLNAVAGYESEPEGGTRCAKCFTHNLTRTGKYALKNGFAEFSTTLTVSPHKNSNLIFASGYNAATNLRADNSDAITATPQFMPFDFKKSNGFQNSIKLSRYYGLYRQSYCGCRV